MVTDDTQDVRRERRVYTFGGDVCGGVAGLWIGGRILGKFFLPGVGNGQLTFTGETKDCAVRDNHWSRIDARSGIWTER